MPLKPVRPPYSKTKADMHRSRVQIDKMLERFGITHTNWNIDTENAKVELTFVIELPPELQRPDQPKALLINIRPPLFVTYHRTWNPQTGKSERTPMPNYAQTFRLLYYYLKAKIESICYGLVYAEHEFMPQRVVKTAEGEVTTIGAIVDQRRLALQELGETAKALPQPEKPV
ncbi:MAG: hypothetical protein QW587_04770 [Candidatus Bathyarchaeia archaeon]